MIQDMPHAKKELNPLWGLLTEPLGQILAAVGLLLAGVLNLVGRLVSFVSSPVTILPLTSSIAQRSRSRRHRRWTLGNSGSQPSARRPRSRQLDHGSPWRQGQEEISGYDVTNRVYLQRKAYFGARVVSLSLLGVVHALEFGNRPKNVWIRSCMSSRNSQRLICVRLRSTNNLFK